MPKFVVNVPESDIAAGGLFKKTPGQFLADYMVRPKNERTRVFDLPHPVRVVWFEADERTKHTETFRRSTSLFGALQRIAYEKSTVTAVTWTGAKIGAGGLYALNYALRTPRGHARGINIVRAFLEDGPGPKTPLGCDWSGLLSFLEIRPIFRVKEATASPLAPTSPSVATPATLDIMSIIP